MPCIQQVGADTPLTVTVVSRQSSVLIHPLVMELDPKSIPANGLLLMLSLEYRRQLKIWGVGAAEGPVGDGGDGGGGGGGDGGKAAGRGKGSIAGADGGIGAVRSLSKQRHYIKDVNGCATTTTTTTATIKVGTKC
jgi:hypothetical protein